MEKNLHRRQGHRDINDINRELCLQQEIPLETVCNASRRCLNREKDKTSILEYVESVVCSTFNVHFEFIII